ncbi:hypothetical protein ACMHYP_22950 [Bacillus cereus]|uniref:hypothetical protein n=1 Tax=Bacillus cereus group TaxID=86661 RepID=UPI0011CB3338|nr:hypothetical protein [Bacillus sp. AR18-7]TXR64557.1 hypothetical protein DN395_11520 [Bacillus sp. AR18-7]
MNTTLTAAKEGKMTKVAKGVKAWLKNEDSQETTDQGMWTYIGIGAAIVALGILIVGVTKGFTNIQNFFVSSTEGAKNNPSGWGIKN